MPATGSGLEPVPEVLDGELLDELAYTRRAMPVVLPPWLRSRDTLSSIAVTTSYYLKLVRQTSVACQNPTGPGPCVSRPERGQRGFPGRGQ